MCAHVVCVLKNEDPDQMPVIMAAAVYHTPQHQTIGYKL